MVKIVALQIKRLDLRLAERKLWLTVDDSACELPAETGYDPQ